MACQSSRRDFSRQQQEDVPGIGMLNLRPITCRKCKGTWHHLKRGTVCAACNNSLVELISDADFQALSKSSNNTEDKKQDKKSGKKEQHSSRTSRTARH